MTRKNLSIVIINYNSVVYLEKCIKSIKENAKKLRYEIIVVDNASYDGSYNMLKNSYPEVIYFQSNCNFGFAYACNLGFEMTQGKYILFLNPDTIVMDDSLEKLISALEYDDLAGLAGCLLLNGDMSIQTSCIQPLPTILNQILDSKYILPWVKNCKYFGISPIYDNKIKKCYVDSISGACMMIKRDVFMKIGKFSEDYFMYLEDIDLCKKVLDRKYKILFVKGAKIIHYGGVSTNNNINALINRKQSMYIYFKKFHGSIKGIIYKFAMGIVSLIRLLILYMAGIFSGSQKNKRISLIKKKWKRILYWSLNLENSIKA